MRKLFIASTILLVLIVPLARDARAAFTPDQFQGDTAIYTGASTHNMPNVLLIVDNSNATLNMASGQSYDNTHNYYNACVAANGASNCFKTLGIYSGDQQGNFKPNQLLVDNPTGTLNTAIMQGTLPNLQCQNPGNILTALLGSVGIGQTSTGGTYQGSATSTTPNLKLKQSTGMGICSTTGQGQAYALGNFLNYTLVPTPPVLVTGSDGKIYQLTVSHLSGNATCSTNPDDQPPSGTQWQTYWSLYTGATPSVAPAPWQPCVPYDLGSNTQQKLIYDALNAVISGARYAVKFGAMVYGKNNSGGILIDPIQDISADPDFDYFMGTLPGGSGGTSVISSQTARPQAEALYDAYQYFLGQSKGTFDQDSFSPVFTSTYCEKLFVILLTNGLPNKENNIGLCNKVGDYDKSGTYNEAPPCGGSSGSYGLGTHYLDDLADMMYTAGVATTDGSGNPSIQRITTNVVLAFANTDPLLQSAAHEGHGSYFQVNNAAALAAALENILANIMLQTDTSFVAPVVPVSPENKVYTGNRVYMGFFKPMSDQYWFGNLKKYALDSKSNILDSTGAFANYVDQNFDFVDDRDGALLPQGAENGSFRATSQSFWSTAPDGGAVDQGGTGAVLLNRAFSVSCPTCNITGTVRNIYTFLGTNTNLTDSSNLFSTLNTALTSSAPILGLPGAVITSGTTTDVKQLINFVHGIDVYDDNGNGNNTEKRAWIFGDVLHSKPFVMNYASYTPFNATTEATCTINKTMIFVASNDGMVHAINDCDGTEAWAFIPPDMLPYLQYLHGATHTYFVDSTIYGYVYDHNQNGTIETSDGDKVVLIIGMRRGGGILGTELEPAAGAGFYYALDVSNPASPVFLWSISNTQFRKGLTTTASTNYAKLGEAWSEPKIVKISAQTSYDSSIKDRIAIFIGGGYDNCNEDGRYGATQTFSGSCQSTIATNDSGTDTSGNPKTSGGTTAVGSLAGYKGSAVYAIELAALNSGAPDFTNGGKLVHAFTTTGYSLLSEMTALDTNFDGYVDRLYMGDTGGNIWRFDVSSTNPTAWAMTELFSSNPGSTNGLPDSSTGRKIFYKPSAVVDIGNIVRLYFGTGDREHPLNLAVTDRMYEVIDKGPTQPTVTDAQLVDVTDDLLQTATDPTAPAFQTLLSNLADTSDPTKTDYYGWYIRLNQNLGEKVLAPATVFNKVVYFTTYAPNTAVVTDPCQIGNLGTARIYVVDYQNGASVMNFDTSNDSQYGTYKTNSYATPTSAGGNVLLRSDRVERIGAGIPSGVVVTGDQVLIGCGGGICTTSTNPGGQVLPVFWRQR
jgi:type IV pilus assembly protein PilY1